MMVAWKYRPFTHLELFVIPNQDYPQKGPAKKSKFVRSVSTWILPIEISFEDISFEDISFEGVI